MKRNNSKKWIKNVTIATAVLVFGIGVGFAAKVAGTPNSDNDGAKIIVAAANDATDSVVKETIAQKETETDTQTAAIKATRSHRGSNRTEQYNCRDSAKDRDCHRGSSGNRAYGGCDKSTSTCCTDSIR